AQGSETVPACVSSRPRVTFLLLGPRIGGGARGGDREARPARAPRRVIPSWMDLRPSSTGCDARSSPGRWSSRAAVPIQRPRASGRRFVPEDSFGEVWGAPFHPRVLSRPEVWAGTLALTGVASAFGFAAAHRDPREPRSPPRLFGKDVSPGFGYSGAAA